MRYPTLGRATPLSNGFLASIVLVCALAGLSLSAWPLATFAALAAIVAIAQLGRAPKPLVLYFLVFLVLQDALVFFAGGETTDVGLLVKRADEVILVCYAAILLVFSRHARALFSNRPLVLSIAGCYVGMIASTLLHPVGLVPIAIDLALFSKPFLLLLIGASLDVRAADIQKFRTPILTAALAVVVFAVLFMLFPDLQDSFIGDFRAPDQRVGIISAQGFFDGPGPYSWFCAATFAFAYAAYLVFARNRYLIASLTSAIFLVLSWRRKSIAGLLAMLVVAVLLRDSPGERRRLRAVLALFLLAAGAATILAPYFGAVIAYTNHEYGGLDPFSNARVALHYTAVLIARDRFPFGTGLATFGSHASRIYYSDTYVQYGLSNIWGLSPEFSGFITDTFWPMVLGEGGAITLISYSVFLIVLFRVSWQLARSNRSGDEIRFFATFALFALAASLLESTSSHIYDATMQSALVMIPAGMLLAFDRQIHADQTSHISTAATAA